MALMLFSVSLIYQIKTLEDSVLALTLILECFNEIRPNVDDLSQRCFDDKTPQFPCKMNFKLSGNFQNVTASFQSQIPAFILEIVFQFLEVLGSFKSWKQLEFDTSMRFCQKMTLFSSLHFLQETGNKLAVVYSGLMLTSLTFLK